MLRTKTASLRRNVVANFIGKGWSAAANILVLPYYVKLLGIESFGLVGFFASLQAVLALLELGLGPTLSQSLARLSVSDAAEDRQKMHDLVRTILLVFLGSGALFAVVIVAMAPLVASHWLSSSALPHDTITQAVALMGLGVAAQWPVGMLIGGLMALERQVLANQLQVAVTTLRTLGALAVLYGVSRSVQAFFLWQAVVSLGYVVATLALLQRSLPTVQRPARFTVSLLVEQWRFAASVAVANILGVLLVQADKVMLSRLLPLAEFGYYSLAWSAAAGLTLLAAPLVAACYPRFCQLVARHDEGMLAGFYHQTCQMVAGLAFSCGAVMCLLPTEVLYLWTGDHSLALHSSAVFARLSLGTSILAVMIPPYHLQLAYGWTRPVVLVNAVAVAVLLPSIYLATQRWGALGAASTWLFLNLGYLLSIASLMHRRLLPGEKRRWYLDDVLGPFAAAFAVAALGRWLPSPEHRALIGLKLTAIGSAALLAATLAAPQLRAKLWR